MNAIAPGRAVILYGEGVEAGDVMFASEEAIAGSGQRAARRIAEVLAAGGVLCTYPDFAYAGHNSTKVRLLGRAYPISSGFVSAAARPHTTLLPCLIRREPHALVCRFYQSVLLDDENEAAAGDGLAARRWRYAATGALVARILEGLIERAGAQWLLLPTLTHEAPQMAGT
jgi:hypothetical protein